MCQEACHQGPTIWDYLAWSPLSESVLCHTCQDLWQSQIEGQVICWGCGRALFQDAQDPYHAVAFWQDQHAYCQECQAWFSRYPIDLIHHQALCPYQGALRQWLHSYKYLGDIRQAQAPAQRLRNFASAHPKAHWLVLPSSPASLAQRQFHATRQLLEVAGLKVVCPFDYVGDGVKQASKSRQQRLALGQVFALKEEVLAHLSGGEWWLFDDVYTTGSTLLRAKSLLYPVAKNRQIPLYSFSLFREGRAEK